MNAPRIDLRERLVRVELGEVRVTADPEETLVTYALGSCVAVIAHDPVRRLGGMIHVMLPDAKASPERAQRQPGAFANTGVALLFEQLHAIGGRRAEVQVKLVGGARIGAADLFEIGARNYEQIRRILDRNGVRVIGEDVGGTISRTVRLEVATGAVVVRSGSKVWSV
jgi:chemotaxis protein CheD